MLEKSIPSSEFDSEYSAPKNFHKSYKFSTRSVPNSGSSSNPKVLATTSIGTVFSSSVRSES